MFARTERLLLRPGWREDAPALFQAICDERGVRNLAQAPWPSELGPAEAFLGRELADGQHELGYWIARPYWGLGFATEAGRALVDNARQSLRLNRLVSGHFIDNPASGRVLAKLGFRPTRTELRYSAGRGAEAPCRVFELDLADAETARAEPLTQAMAA